MWRAIVCAASISSTAPIAKLGATKQLASPASAASRSASRSKPVVPRTTWTPASKQALALASAVSGVLKSTTTSASPSTPASSTPSAGSAFPASCMSTAPSTASQTVWPMRPAAPETATRIMRPGSPRRAPAPRGSIPRRGRRRQPRAARGRKAPPPARSARRLRREHEAALDVLLRPRQLGGRDRLAAQAVKLGADNRAGLLDVVLAGPHVGRDQAGVGVLLAVGADRVGEAALLAYLAEEPRGGRAAEDRVEHGEPVAALVVAHDARRAEADVVLLGVLRVEAQAARGGGLLGRRRAIRPGGRRDEALGERDDLFVLEVAGGADDDVGAGVAVLAVGLDVRHRDRGDHLGLAEHAPAQRVRARRGRGDDVVDAVLRLVLVHRDLLQHDVALGVDFGVGWRQQHLRQQVEDLLGC